MNRADAPERALIKDFEVVSTLGKGSFATAYLARDLQLNVLRVIKVLNAKLLTADDDDYVALFQQEAQALALINDENVARVLTCGTTADDCPFFVMDHLPGKDLRAVIRDQKGKPIEILHAINLGIQVFDGLSAAHDAGIVHRDIKPENIFIVPQGWGRDASHMGRSLKAKIIDFGTFGVSGTTEVRGDTVIYRGTPRYSAPEMFDGLPATPACDIYSVGIMLYELVTGRTPFARFRADDFQGLSEAHASERPRCVREFRAEVPAQLDRFIDACLQKKPDERPRSAEWAAQRLRALKDELDRSATATHAVTARNIELRGASISRTMGGTQRLSSPRFVEDNATDIDGFAFDDVMREKIERGELGPPPQVLPAEEAALYELDRCEPEPRIVSISTELTRTASDMRATHKLTARESRRPAEAYTAAIVSAPPCAPAVATPPTLEGVATHVKSARFDGPAEGPELVEPSDNENAWNEYEAGLAQLLDPRASLAARSAPRRAWTRALGANLHILIFLACVAVGLAIAFAICAKPARSMTPPTDAVSAFVEHPSPALSVMTPGGTHAILAPPASVPVVQPVAAPAASPRKRTPRPAPASPRDEAANDFSADF